MPYILPSGRSIAGGALTQNPIAGAAGALSRLPSARIAVNGGLLAGETQLTPVDNLSPVAQECMSADCIAASAALTACLNAGGILDTCSNPLPAPTASPIVAGQGTVSTATAGASVNVAPVVAAPVCSFALFGDTSCFTIGSTTIGTTTALVLGAALVALLMAFGGKK